jgi:hypothetical protein
MAIGAPGGGFASYSYDIDYSSPGWTIGHAFDYNGDGISDYDFDNETTGRYIRGTGVAGGNIIEYPTDISASPGWTQGVTAEFTGNTVLDTAWYNKSTGRMVFHPTPFGGTFDYTVVTNFLQPGWTSLASGTFGGDGVDDYLFYNSTSGRIAMYQGITGGGVIAAPLFDSVQGVTTTTTTTTPPTSTTTTTAVPVPSSALNPDGRAPCYYLPEMTLPVARCSGIYTYGFQNGPVAGAGLGVPGSIAGNSYLAVIRLPESGSSSDNHLVAQLGGCANGQSGQLLAVKNFGGQIQTTRTDCINGYYSYHAVNSVLGFGSSTEYKVLQVTLPQGSGVSNKIYVDGVDMGISYESIPGLAFDCCYPGPYGETALSLSPGPPNFGQNINSLKYVTILQGTAPLSPAQAAALLAAVMPPTTTTTTTTAVVSSTTTTPSGPLSGALTASIVRGPNNAAGASVYSVTLKVTGATSGGSYEFVVPSGHVPDPVPLDRVTHRYPKTAVAGEVVWEYSLVAPRGVYRAEVYSAGGSTPISTVEVK